MKTKEVLKQQKIERLNEEQKTLLAICLWVYREQAVWKGHLPSMWRFIKGGEYKMDSFVTKEWVPNCIDSGLMVQVLAEKMGINGGLKIKGKYHRYWQSEAGNIVDIWWGYHRGGLYTNPADYESRAREKNERNNHSCGTRWKNKNVSNKTNSLKEEK